MYSCTCNGEAFEYECGRMLWDFWWFICNTSILGYFDVYTVVICAVKHAYSVCRCVCGIRDTRAVIVMYDWCTALSLSLSLIPSLVLSLALQETQSTAHLRYSKLSVEVRVHTHVHRHSTMLLLWKPVMHIMALPCIATHRRDGYSEAVE